MSAQVNPMPQEYLVFLRGVEERHHVLHTFHGTRRFFMHSTIEEMFRNFVELAVESHLRDHRNIATWVMAKQPCRCEFRSAGHPIVQVTEPQAPQNFLESVTRA